MTIARFLVISLLLVFLFAPTTANAAPKPTPTPPPCPANFTFPCRSEVQAMINTALQPIEATLTSIQNTISTIQSSLSQLTTTVNTTKNNQTTDEATITSQETEIAKLQVRVANLEASESSELNPKTVSFASNRAQPFNSDWINVSVGYNTITINLSITGFITNYGVHYTDDPTSATDSTGFTVQGFQQCNSQTTCPPLTLPI